MSLEVVGPERLSVSRSVTVTAKGIQKLESSPVVGGKLEGCLGASISALLARVVGECGAGVSGVFEAEDGAKTEPIEMCELVQGTIVHSDPSGGPLPHKQGGPLRVTLVRVRVRLTLTLTLALTVTVTLTVTLAVTVTLALTPAVTVTLTLTR